jgi:hypothetical protein
MTDIEDRWTKRSADLLVGRRIVSVEYMTEEDANEVDWNHRPLIITLDNGLRFYPSRDDEGNGPGALFTTHQTIHTIPTI